jgi:diguanylate cyclase (GGDEF)-like protein
MAEQGQHEQAAPAEEERSRIDTAPFYREMFASAKAGRSIMLTVPLLVFGLAPLYGRIVPSMPALPLDDIRAVEFGLIVPLALLGLLVNTSRWFDHRSGVLLFSVLLVAMICALRAIRVFGEPHGFLFPTSTGLVVVVCAFFLFGLPFRIVCPAILAAWLGAELVEWLLVDRAPGRLLQSYADGILVAVCAVSAYRLEGTRLVEWLRRQAWESRAKTDQLTGLMTRWAFEPAFEHMMASAHREQRRVVIAVVDLDEFKALNDHHGHEHGDFALSEVGRELAHMCRRSNDLAVRWGGEEFIMVWYDSTREFARAIGDWIVDTVTQLGIPNDRSQVSPTLTASVGVLSRVPTATDTPGLLIREADAQLLLAKQQGRKRSCVSVD